MLKEQMTAPDFTLASDRGTEIRLKDLRGKPVVLYFYPKDLTSGCTQEAEDFKAVYSRWKRKGIEVLGVSRDSVEKHQKFSAQLKLPFALLSDEEGKVCQAYGVWKEKSMYGRKYMGIERTTFVIDPRGKIVKIYPKVKVTNHVKDVQTTLETLPS